MIGRDFISEVAREVADAPLRKAVQSVNARAVAEEALRGLSDKDKVHFALKLILDTTDGQAAGTLSFAANRITEHAHILMREAFERECG